MKKALTVFLCVLLCMGSCVTAFAMEEDEFEENLILDHANVLGKGQERQLQLKLEALSREFQVYLYLLTESSIEEGDSKAYAEKYYLSKGLGCGEKRDGILLFLCIERQEIIIYANGVGDQAISEEAALDISNKVFDELANGSYVKAVECFGDECMVYLEAEVNREKNPVLAMVSMVVFLGTGAALIITGLVRKRKQKNPDKK